jgi:hypothetical protein
MGMFFGDATLQSPADVASAINYNPQRQLGSGSGNYMANTFDSDQTSEQVASQEKKDSVDVGASVGGGSGSGGQVDKYTGGETDTLNVGGGLASVTKYLPYIAIGGVVIIAGFFMFKKKKK